ncbi:universal stress protein [Mariniflexile litorale]|uniref:Universal stress protein n=1 Tax=Mariniflexile litorale TaxID=3045158 RepID=A0AAU7EEF5_9FLAO|nr:universal stress protein [Mariniflexile sp. KMM 9835]MDQ8212437.1 universal stress protein [Mariniflexile sp. KMM 9835]
MRKILVPTDFSENALNALDYALELFKYDICEFYIMHAYQDDIYADKVLMKSKTIDELTRVISDKSQLQLEGILKHVSKVSPNSRHTYHVVSSNNMLIDEADKIVDEECIDIIVMGTRGKTNDRKLTFGSHTLQVLKYVQCPVLAIPENYKHIQPRRILFPTNYMIPYKRRELKLLCDMASPYRAVIDMLYISKSKKLSLRQQNHQDFINEALCKNKINFKIVDNKNITNAIYTYIKENDINMLVMVNTRHSFLENILFQSTIDEISLYIEIPFLVLQNMRRN